MGALDFTWNAIQSGQIGTLEEQVAELRAIVYNLHKWIQYQQTVFAQLAVEGKVEEKKNHDWIIKKIPGTKDQYFVETGSPPEDVLRIYGIVK